MLRVPRSSVTFEPSPNFGNLVSRDSLHVQSNMEGGWWVRRHGSRRAIRSLPTKGEAIRLARKIARKWKTDFAIHGRDGWVEAIVSYASDPKPSKKVGR
jgi:hypothetical protein